MPQRTVFNISLVTASANAIALSQMPGAAGNLTLAGALVVGGVYTAADAAHIISITSDANDSGVTFTVTGTNQDGVSISETVTGPNTATVKTTKFFKTVSSVSISAAATGNITVGISDSVISPTIQINTRTSNFNVTNEVAITGTINYTVSHTCDNIMNTPFNAMVGNKPTTTVTYFPDANLTGQTSSKMVAIQQAVAASQLTINSYSAGATLRWSIVEIYA